MPRFVPIALANAIRAHHVRDFPGLGVTATAKRFGVSRTTARRIVRGTWAGGEPHRERRPPARPIELWLDVHVAGGSGSFHAAASFPSILG